MHTGSSIRMVRHGESEANVKKQIVGVKDSPLTTKGIEEAHEYARALKGDFDFILTSPLNRAKLTADIIGAYTCKPVIEIPELRPQCFGVIEGMTVGEVKDAGLGNYLYADDDFKYEHFVEGGETQKQLEQRVYPTFLDMSQRIQAGLHRVLLVNHNSYGRVLVGKTNGMHHKERTNMHLTNFEEYELNRETGVMEKSKVPTLEQTHEGIHDDLRRYLHICRVLKTSKDPNAIKEKLELKSKLSRLIGVNAKGTELIREISRHSYEPFNDGHHIGTEKDRPEASLFNSVKNTEELNLLMQEYTDLLLPHSIGILHFGSSYYASNYNLRDNSDLDFEVIFDKDTFDPSIFDNELFAEYNNGDGAKDFEKFIRSRADYYTVKFQRGKREIDIRFTHKDAFEGLCNYDLNSNNPLILREFRTIPRPNGIVNCRLDFDGIRHVRENPLTYDANGQTIHYPLYKINEFGRFVCGNNIDKYACVYGLQGDVIFLNQCLHASKLNTFKRYVYEQENGLLSPGENDIMNIYLRKDYFPLHIKEKIKKEVEVFQTLYM